MKPAAGKRRSPLVMHTSSSGRSTINYPRLCFCAMWQDKQHISCPHVCGVEVKGMGLPGATGPCVVKGAVSAVSCQ